MRYMVGDATQLDLPAGSCDVVFSNWLLMYLSDEECAKLAADALTWVSALSLHPCAESVAVASSQSSNLITIHYGSSCAGLSACHASIP